MNRKKLPLLSMLTAGAVMCIITFINQYTALVRLTSLFGIMLLFYFLGNVLKWTLDFFESQNEKKRQEEGAVIEKDGEETAETKEEQ